MKNLNVFVTDEMKERLDLESLLQTALGEVYYSQAEVVRKALDTYLSDVHVLRQKLRRVPEDKLAKAKAKVGRFGVGKESDGQE